MLETEYNKKKTVFTYIHGVKTIIYNLVNYTL